jgi:hypothetical protein
VYAPASLAAGWNRLSLAPNDVGQSIADAVNPSHNCKDAASALRIKTIDLQLDELGQGKG